MGRKDLPLQYQWWSDPSQICHHLEQAAHDSRERGVETIAGSSKMSVALDNVMESQAAQLNLLLYQIYRPYFNGKSPPGSHRRPLFCFATPLGGRALRRTVYVARCHPLSPVEILRREQEGERRPGAISRKSRSHSVDDIFRGMPLRHSPPG